MGQKQDAFTLSPQQEQFLYALLRSKTKEDAARMAGIVHSQVYRHLGNNRIMAAYRAARRQAFDGALAVPRRAFPPLSWLIEI